MKPVWNIPAQAVVEALSEPTPELFDQHLPALASLLRMALLSGMELTLPTVLHVLLDVSQTMIAADRHLVIFADRQDPGSHLQVGRYFDPPPVPGSNDNLLHTWAGRAGKPLLVNPGMDTEMDAFLHRVEARAAVAVPLFIEHDWAGSLQMFRDAATPFSATDARLLWILSLLAENQMARINVLRHLTRMAYTDFLTGLRARGYFEQALEQEVHRALRKNSSCALLLVDLDNFKLVNDRYGHAAGDDVLRQFARLIVRDMRDIDTVARFGGDEFAVILPDIDENGVRFVASRIREAVRSHRFHLTEQDIGIQLSLSVGVAVCPSDERTPGQLLRAADLALYQAKQRGKDALFFWRELRKAG
jgi:diguanylate cyclase (GGDEF)-like protein